MQITVTPHRLTTTPKCHTGDTLSAKGLFDFVKDGGPGEVTNLRLAGVALSVTYPPFSLLSLPF